MLDKHQYEGQGHWLGQKANPHDYLGFIYLIVDETTCRKYIGRKNYWLKKSGAKGCKSAVSDKSSPKWKSSCWKQSDWMTYSGSSPSFKKWVKKHPDHTYTHYIIRQCRNRSELHYGEVEELVARGALWKMLVEPISQEDDNGYDSNFEYFNRQIPATKFRVKTWEDLLEYEKD